MDTESTEKRPSKREALYSPSQASEYLGIPGSTLRRLCIDYGQYLSETARVSGKKRFFTDTDLIILRRLSQLVKSRRPQEEIERLLQVVDEASPEEKSLSLLPTLLPQVAQQIEALRIHFSQLEDEREQDHSRIERLQMQVEQLVARQEERDREEIERLREQVAQLTEQLEQRRPLWERLFKKRPPEPPK